ncbi:MAG TPA: hypothetical protein PLW02_07535, partial [Verrucomicrobiota bacterium]|nr:hypothetical protein [Verrucomicrobiota bacterium]
IILLMNLLNYHLTFKLQWIDKDLYYSCYNKSTGFHVPYNEFIQFFATATYICKKSGFHKNVND